MMSAYLHSSGGASLNATDGVLRAGFSDACLEAVVELDTRGSHLYVPFSSCRALPASHVSLSECALRSCDHRRGSPRARVHGHGQRRALLSERESIDRNRILRSLP